MMYCNKYLPFNNHINWMQFNIPERLFPGGSNDDELLLIL